MLRLILLVSIILLVASCNSSSEYEKLPVLHPVEEEERENSKRVTWEGSGSIRTNVFSVEEGRGALRWNYDPPGVNIYDFTLQMIDAKTHTPSTISLLSDSTTLGGSGLFKDHGDFYFVIQSNGDWKIVATVSK